MWFAVSDNLRGEHDCECLLTISPRVELEPEHNIGVKILDIEYV